MRLLIGAARRWLKAGMLYRPTADAGWAAGGRCRADDWGDAGGASSCAASAGGAEKGSGINNAIQLVEY